MKRIIASLLLLAMFASIASAAITVAITDASVQGNKRVNVGTVTLDTSYRNGGEAITAANLGLSQIVWVEFTCDGAGYVPQYDYSAAKLVMYAVQDSLHAALYGAMADIAPDTNAVDLSAVIVKFKAEGY